PACVCFLHHARTRTPPRSTLFAYTTLFRSQVDFRDVVAERLPLIIGVVVALAFLIILAVFRGLLVAVKAAVLNVLSITASYGVRSEEHTSELQSREDLVCRLLLERKKELDT